jgi:hypothetical protein
VAVLIRSCRDGVLEISIATALMRFLLLMVALLLSVAVAARITSPRIIAADLVAISLLYFLAADFVSVGRLAAFAKLRDTSAQPALPEVHSEGKLPDVLMTSDPIGTETGPRAS